MHFRLRKPCHCSSTFKLESTSTPTPQPTTLGENMAFSKKNEEHVCAKKKKRSGTTRERERERERAAGKTGAAGCWRSETGKERVGKHEEGGPFGTGLGLVPRRSAKQTPVAVRLFIEGRASGAGRTNPPSRSSEENLCSDQCCWHGRGWI